MAYGNITLFQPSEFMKIPFIPDAVTPLLSDFCKEIRGVSDYYDKIGFDSRVDHLYDSGICLIGSPAGLGNGLSILGHFAGLVLVSGVSWKIILPVILLLAGGLAGFLFLFLSEGVGLFCTSK